MIAAAGCVRVPYQRADAMSAEPIEKLGEDRLSLHWKFMTADRRTEVSPQEFAAAAVYADTIYIGSASGEMFALRAANGTVRWRKTVGAVGSAPLISGGMIFLGTMDGVLVSLDAQTGKEMWRYHSRGPIEQTPAATTDLIVFSNEADQVVAVDAYTGKFKWQFKSETPENYTLRGHAGVTIDGDLIYTGFSNGTMVALRKDTGSVAWSTSLKGDADRFVDVDATPLVLGDKVYATSSSGGVFALDKATGLVRWRVPFYDVAQPSETGNVGGIVSDGKILYVSVAELGTYAMDLNGNTIWRVGAKGGGEPGPPVIFGELLVYTLAEDGLFIANRKTGETLEYFDPGSGISAAPTITGDGRLFVMSNRGIIYAFDLD
jgi:outer membrane protein assembly factor BamB